MNHHRCPSLLTAIIITLTLMITTGHARIDDPAYHRYDRVQEKIFALQDSFPQMVKIDTIGFSQVDQVPIYSVFVARDIGDTALTKPSVVIIGQVHAEEVLGVEYCMWLLEKMVTREGRNWRNRVNTYIIPTANPEGLNVVYSLDYTYRKNKRDNIGDGKFRYQFAWGSDTSGVDINRNFPLWWIHGDQFLVRGGANEFYDYYRGPAPASEEETRTLIKFFDKVRPYYSITLHSSRTGNVAEKVIYPWGFGRETKFSPDVDAFNELAYQVARRCKRYGDTRTYEPNIILQPRGDSEVFYYYKYGTYAMRVEIGAEGEAMQPDSAGIYEVINDVADGLQYVLNSAAGITDDRHGVIRTSRLDIVVRDASNNQPIGNARLVLDKWKTNMIPYRKTHSTLGHYHWMVNDAVRDTLQVSKFGYKTVRRVVSSGRDPSPVNVMLTPLPEYTVQLRILQSNGQEINRSVDLTIEHPDSVWTETFANGSSTKVLPEGNYKLTLYAEDKFVPRVVDVSVVADTIFQIALSPAVALLNENFDNADVVYTTNYSINTNSLDSLQRWELTPYLYRTPPRSLTDSKRGNMARKTNSWCAPYNLLDNHFDLSSTQTASLIYWLNQALEPDYDSMWVEISTGGASGSDPADWVWFKPEAAPSHQKVAILKWQEMDDYINRPWNAPPINLLKYHDWERFIIPLDDYIGESEIHFRFRIASDDFDEEDGVYIDDVQLLASGELPPPLMSEHFIPLDFSLGEAYPNPFNSQFRIRVNLPDAADLQATVYDLNGREVLKAVDGFFSAGSHALVIDGHNLSSGVYFLRVNTPDDAAIRKITLIR